MKCIVYQTATGVEITTSAPRGKHAERDDDAHIAALSARLYPGGGYVIVDKADLPVSGESTTDWTVVDGRVVLK